MKQRVSLRCRCGTVRGVAVDVSPDDGNHGVCYCDDCQTYAHFLERADVLDPWGGTHLFQMAPGRITLTAGQSELRCVRLSPKGLYRFYAGCCRTPIGNCVGRRLPFVGVVHAFMDHAADGQTREQVLGPPIVRAQGQFAHGAPPFDVHPRWPPRILLRSVRLLLRWAITGQGKRTPFFDEAGAPRVPPQVLGKAERDTLRARVTAGSAAN